MTRRLCLKPARMASVTSLVEHVVVVEVGHVVVGLGIGRHLEIGVDAEQLADGHLHVRQAGSPGLGLGAHSRLVSGLIPGAGTAASAGRR